MHIYMELQGFQAGLPNRGAIQGEDHRNVLTDPSLRQCPGFLRFMQCIFCILCETGVCRSDFPNIRQRWERKH